MNFNSFTKKDYELDIPYPKVPSKLNLSSSIISKLVNEYVGNKGEFTGLSQYSYQSFLLKNTENETLSKILEQIAIKEMQHLSILSQVLKSCSVLPRFCRCIDNNSLLCSYWSTQNVDFSFKLDEIILSDIKLEKKAIAMYNEIIETSQNDELNKIINRILKDEYKHLDFFNKVQIILKEKNTSREEKIEDFENNNTIKTEGTITDNTNSNNDTNNNEIEFLDNNLN